MITRYVSKVGNESLIFNPTVYLCIEANDRGRNSAPSAVIPATTIYRVNGMLTKVYRSIVDQKMYRAEGRSLYLDSNVAAKCIRKLSLYRNTLVVAPAVLSIGDADDRHQIMAVSFSVDDMQIGLLGHQDLLNLIDVIGHMDINSYTMMAGIIDQLSTMDTKLDRILEILNSMQAPIRVPLPQMGGQPMAGLTWTQNTTKGLL